MDTQAVTDLNENYDKYQKTKNFIPKDKYILS